MDDEFDGLTDLVEDKIGSFCGIDAPFGRHWEVVLERLAEVIVIKYRTPPGGRFREVS